MKRVERQQRIVELVNEEKKVLAKDLAAKLKVSEDTIRRDLRELDQKKLVRRIHSGAIQIGPPETMFQYRVNSKTNEKNLLAKKAASLVHEDSVILIDGGTSNLAFAKALNDSFRATIITNSPPVVMALEMHQNLEVIDLGGTLNHKYMVNMGLEMADKITKIRADYYLMGMYNIDAVTGLTVPTLEESLLKKYMSESSMETISLVTEEKLDTISNYVIGPVSMLDTMVTTGKDTKAYAEAGVKVWQCEDE
ncbi:DeoR/GlpR family DNA-binding transcription regulator [Candidatus Enterococcus ferrettii]|uniref:Lactose phosphotransferase system repressor n=1 Tax=Candidatus Enterococcus ferrettii TaxID=2815324 RepID=A0ABV0EVJ0_9ENTE|nr:DeoR/GlpR family DNA-binding transcription regulator [Enterococcus sp. 665A]MBO1342348.1 DeoR/GlpR transcriptional regulator [Enterococcus sp. 665A]